MTEHWIRLRGGWTVDRENASEPAGWLTLPLASPLWPDAPRAVRRNFQTPSVDPEREAIWLVIAETPGLRSIRLNGEPIVADATGMDSLEIQLPVPLPRRCLLELELGKDSPGAVAGGWGQVALVIRPIEAAWRESGEDPDRPL